jgi:hypothetical protein
MRKIRNSLDRIGCEVQQIERVINVRGTFAVNITRGHRNFLVLKFDSN